MRRLWLSIRNTYLPGQGGHQRCISRYPSRRRDLRQPASWVGSLLGLLLFVHCGVSTVLGAETPRLPRRSPLPQAPAPGPAPGAVRAPVPTGPVAGVTLQDNRLSVDVLEQDLRAVLETIATQGGIEVRHAEGLPNTRVSVRFAALPVLDGLKRLFRAADVTSYALITETAGENVQVRRILFLPVPETAGSPRPVPPTRRPLPGAASGAPASTEPNPAQAAPQQAESDRREEATSGGSVFDDIKNNTAARRLLSQLVHPNEQVRDRALERLVQLVSDDQKQAELLETLEPLMENLSSEDKAARDDARTEIRKLLNR